MRLQRQFPLEGIRLRSLLCLVAGMAGMLFLPGSASGAWEGGATAGEGSAPTIRHTKLIRSAPAPDTALGVSPTAITLWFTKPVQLRLTRIRLTDGKGAVVTLATPAFVDATETSVVSTLRGIAAPGTYRVTWASTSKDSHVIKGSFDFKIVGHPTARGTPA